MNHKNIRTKLKKYHFELRHITVILLILVVFQFIFSLVQKSSLEDFLHKTQKWYQKESAERIANLSTTSLELLIENIYVGENFDTEFREKIIESFNIIFSQHLLEQHVQLSSLLVFHEGKPIVIDDGKTLFDYLTGNLIHPLNSLPEFEQVKKLFKENENILREQEQIFSTQFPEQTFHVLVPLVPHGEFLGVFYMKNTPNFSFVTQNMLSGYNEVAIVYSSLILLGLIAMYFISSYSVRERDKAQKLFFEEHERHLKDQIMHDKESLFTKRIYHTHHKSEKVMGFIKEDLQSLNKNNISEVKEKLFKYSNFVSRVIYDMKWYDPPIQTIRNSIFNTDINDAINFIVNNLFLRISSQTDIFEFILNLDKDLPKVSINEYVVWEILEPLIQNSIDHGDTEKLKIKISTFHFNENKTSTIIVQDNGIGIRKELLEVNEDGIKKIFSENSSTKFAENQNRGYGCYIAYEIATKRCGWKLDVNNLEQGGCEFKITF
ncbi:MAG: ATP-binding protein [Melioribacteraceae bacterium]